MGKSPLQGKRFMAGGKTHREYLTFRFLDDVLLLPEEERQKKIDRSIVNRIGPLMEYVSFDLASGRSYLGRSEASEAQLLSRVLRTVSSPRASHFTSLAAQRVEFFKIPQTETEFGGAIWTAFCKRLQSAAKEAGLPEGFANQLAGTFWEMSSNVVEHSEHPETGIVGYKWKQGEFEYVVADNGIGILNSLKQHPDYANLVDSGQALETALSDGESRYGRQAHRGTGFNTLILNIASRNSYLRFRSSDHCHTVDGTGPASRLTAQLYTHFQGFFVSVVCRP